MKIGRNDPCPCGSKLKYKKCCLLKIDELESLQKLEWEEWFAKDLEVGAANLAAAKKEQVGQEKQEKS